MNCSCFLFKEKMAGALEEKSLQDVCEWLEEKGFGDTVIEAFRGNAGLTYVSQETASNLTFLR